MRSWASTRKCLATLTDVEREVLSLVVQGYEIREIAARRGKAESTIKNQVFGILTKFQCSKRTELLFLLMTEAEQRTVLTRIADAPD